jgi:hypothetical protein
MSDQPIHSDLRICNTSDLRILARKDPRNGLTPQINAILDEHGNHVLRRALFGHNMDAKVDQPLQHRIKALCKIRGTHEPVEVMFDMLDSDWRRLLTASEVTGR